MIIKPQKLHDIAIILLIAMVSSCKPLEIATKDNNTNNTNKQKQELNTSSSSQSSEQKTKINNSFLVLDAEKKQLAKIEKYIRNTTHLIDRAKALQNDNARYKFIYSRLRADLDDITSAIYRHIKENNRQTPRNITPLKLAY